MVLSPFVYNVLADTNTPALTDTLTDAGTTSVITGTFDNLINVDLVSLLCNNFAETLAIGFALSTILILITYGAFKVFNLVRIN